MLAIVQVKHSRRLGNDCSIRLSDIRHFHAESPLRVRSRRCAGRPECPLLRIRSLEAAGLLSAPNCRSASRLMSVVEQTIAASQKRTSERTSETARLRQEQSFRVSGKIRRVLAQCGQSVRSFDWLPPVSRAGASLTVDVLTCPIRLVSFVTQRKLIRREISKGASVVIWRTFDRISL